MSKCYYSLVRCQFIVVANCRIEGGEIEGGEREVVVTQCLLLPTGTHHSYTTHTVLRGEGGGGGEGDPNRSYAVSAPADRDASQLYYSYRIKGGGGGWGRGGGGWGRGGWGWGWGWGGGDPSRSYAVSAPADRDASQLYYSYRIIRGRGGGGGGGGGHWGKGEVGGCERDPGRSHVSVHCSYTALPSCLATAYSGNTAFVPGVWGFLKPGGWGGGGPVSVLHSKLPGGGLVSVMPASVDRVHHDLCHIA